jgi:hypothetical protein
MLPGLAEVARYRGLGSPMPTATSPCIFAVRGWRRMCMLAGLAEVARFRRWRSPMPMAASPCISSFSAGGDEWVAESNV